jgi:hypothetical protein
MAGRLHVDELRRELPFVFSPRPARYPWPVFDPGSFDRIEVNVEDFDSSGGFASTITDAIQDALSGVSYADPGSWSLQEQQGEIRDRASGLSDEGKLAPAQTPERQSGASEQNSPVGPPPPHDALAWYQPFHFFPDDWGIFLKEGAIVDIATIVCAGFEAVTGKPLTRPIISECARASILILYQHEFFHHQLESFSARCEVYSRNAVYVPQFKAPHWLLEEALANARAYLRTGPKGPSKLDPDVSRAARAFQKITYPFAPPGYRDAIQYLTQTRFTTGVNNLQESVHRCGGGARPAAPRIWKAAPHEIRGFGNKASPIYCVVDRAGSRRFPLLFYSFSSRDLERLAERMGGRIDRAGGKGSHVKAYFPGRRPVVIPGERKDVASGTAHNILRQLGCSPREALAMLRA